MGNSHRIALACWISFLGFGVWGIADNQTVSHPCLKVRGKASPLSIRLRVVEGTSEQKYIECVRWHEDTMRVLTERDIKPIAEEELIRLSKLTQEERDREDCQKMAFKPTSWASRSLFDRVEEEIKNPRLKDKQTIKLYHEVYAFCKRFR